MVDLTVLPIDIYYLINKLLYSYDNNLIFVNNIHNNPEFINCYFKIIKERLFRLKQTFSCIKIQSFIKNKFIYFRPIIYLSFTTIFDYPHYHINGDGISSIFGPISITNTPDINQIEIDVSQSKNKKKYRKTQKNSTQKKSTLKKYKKHMYKNSPRYPKKNYKSFKHSYRKR